MWNSAARATELNSALGASLLLTLTDKSIEEITGGQKVRKFSDKQKANLLNSTPYRGGLYGI